MSRVTSANRCAQIVPGSVAGKPVTLTCTKAEAHKGDHKGAATWAQKCPPTPRR